MLRAVPLIWCLVMRSSRVVVLLAVAAAIALSVAQGLEARVGHDFHVFWQAGRNFATGSPLYHGYLPGAREFKYPPFAAFVLQLVALAPLRVAAVLFSLLNLGLWALAVILTRDIVARTLPDRTPARWPLILAVVLSARFFLDNFRHVQVNGVILVLVLLGIQAYLQQRDVRAAAYFVAATALKLTPAFFVAWLLVRGRRRAALAVLPLAAACVLLPLLARGPAAGAAELVEYYQTFLEGHRRAEVGKYTAGQSLAAMVNRMTLPPGDPTQTSYAYLPGSEHTARLVYQGLWATVLLAFLAKLGLLRIRRAPPSAVEFGMTFLAALLLSPITFTHHLVSLLYVFCAFLAIRPTPLSRWERPVAVLLFIAMAVTGLGGRDLAGRSASLFVWGYSVPAWTLLLLFVTAVVYAGRDAPETATSG